MANLRAKLREYYEKLGRQAGTPERVAGGLAVGVFVGFIVPPGLQVAVVLLVGTMFSFNRVVGLAGTLVTNPLTMPFVYYAELRFGQWLTGLHAEDNPLLADPDAQTTYYAMLTDWETYRHALLSMLVGALVFATVGAGVSYWGGKALVVRYRRGLARWREKHHHPGAPPTSVPGTTTDALVAPGTKP